MSPPPVPHARLSPSAVLFVNNDNTNVQLQSGSTYLKLSNDQNTSVELRGVATPSVSDAAVPKSYVDSVAAGLSWKASVRAASTASVTISNVTAGSSLDGVTLAADDRILLKNQTTASENGIYVVAASGSPSRASDMATGSNARSVAVFVSSGSVNADVAFVVSSDSAIVGTNDLAWTQFTGVSNITAGSGLNKSGNTLSVGVDGSTIEILGNNLRVVDGGLSNGKLENSSITINAGSGLTGGGVVQLGASTTLSLDTANLVQKTGSQSMAGPLTITDTADYDAANPALVVSGGVSVTGGISSASLITAPSVYSTSDAELKTNVVPISDEQKNSIHDIKPVSFEWVDRRIKGLQYGVIAQQIKEVYPHLVHENEAGYLSVNYSGLIAPMIAEIQALRRDLEAMR